MKYFLQLFAFLFLAVGSAQAQYWIIPNINAGENPRGLNEDIEQPSVQSAWTTILPAPQATPAWSTSQTIPFSFLFNGSAVTQFKASSTGVVTFDVSTALPAPSASNTALPDATIPDNSVVIWGLQGTGSNDAVITKTFGTAPNRQFWIQYNSYSIAANSAAWCYWSIVLEETTNRIYIVDHRSGSNAGPITTSLTAGIQINATTAISVAGSPALNTTTAQTLYDNPTDNSYYTFVPGTQPANDLEVTKVSPDQYVSVGTNVPMEITVRNLGTSSVSSYTIKYQEGANPVVSQMVSANLATFATNTTQFTVPYNVASVGTHSLNVWVELANDADATNDQMQTTVYGTAFTPNRVVVMEEPTGTWCGWCVRGIVFMDSIHYAHPNDVAAISVHNSDPMAHAAYDAYMGTLISGYPSLVVDRKFVGDPSDAFTAYNDYIGDFGFAEITQTHTSSGNNYTVVAQVKPAIDLNGEYRLAMVVTEDDVTGTTSNYNQANYYSSSSQNIPLSGGGVDYQASPNPIPAAQMHYNFVARDIVGGAQGASGSLPSSMVTNNNYSYTFNYTQPTTSNAAKMRFIVLMIETSTGKILNASIDGFYPAGFSDLANHPNIKITAYPNPVQDRMFLDMDLQEDLHNVSYSIQDMFGKTISQLNLGKVSKDLSHTFQVDVNNLPAGSYIVNVNCDEGRFSTTFIKR